MWFLSDAVDMQDISVLSTEYKLELCVSNWFSIQFQNPSDCLRSKYIGGLVANTCGRKHLFPLGACKKTKVNYLTTVNVVSYI